MKESRPFHQMTAILVDLQGLINKINSIPTVEGFEADKDDMLLHLKEAKVCGMSVAVSFYEQELTGQMESSISNS